MAVRREVFHAVEVRMGRILAMNLVVGPLALACAAGGDAGQEGTSSPSYAADVEPLFAKRCGNCHSMKEGKAHLVLAPGKGYGELVGKAAFQAPDLMRVRAGDAEASYLWQKLRHTAREGKGMPRTLFGAKKLPEKELALAKAWIEAGALP